MIPDGLYPSSFPRIPGHEIVGDIVALPASEKVWKLGQRVGGGWHGGHCHTCPRCRVGDFITCQHEDINGKPPSILHVQQVLTRIIGVFRDGGYAEYAILRSEAVITIPDGLDPVQAAPLLCAGITVYSMSCLLSKLKHSKRPRLDSLRHMNAIPPDYVAVQGIGLVAPPLNSSPD